MTSAEQSSKLTKELQNSLENCKFEAEKKEQELSETINELKKQLSDAQVQIQDFSQGPKSPNVSLIDPEVVADLKEEVEILKGQNAMIKEENSRLTAENEEINHLSHSLRLEISQLKTNLEEKDEEMATYRESAREVKVYWHLFCVAFWSILILFFVNFVNFHQFCQFYQF